MDYAFHFHFFGKLPSSEDDVTKRKEDVFSQWLLEVADFSALPGKGVQCWINGKKILVSYMMQLPGLLNTERKSLNFMLLFLSNLIILSFKCLCRWATVL
jgi:hypothetical protein